jgi:signal transduction histidine kinase
MTSLEMHANGIETLLQNSAPVKGSGEFAVIFTFLISLLSFYIVLAWHPVHGLLYLLGTGLVVYLLAVLLFIFGGILLPIAKPLIALFLSYYFLIPYRLIIEIRKNLEYRTKNKMLSQIEELKTNFISMMSHDLKTPLARIQGMAQMVKGESKQPLSPGQIEALDQIQNSAGDLVKFVDVVLKYAQVENQQIHLQKESRDINQLVEEVIRKHDFLLKLKQIKLQKEFEPLFPMELDSELIKQVLSNLIENAIKYSPSGSKILISTEEVEGKVRVQVADQGQGIAPQDLPFVFMKFFRSSAVKSSDIKGSGLGLYLADYFVKLHGGRIEVESEPGQGSTFTVELPLPKPLH